jgi:hypothetical protein
MIKEEKSFHRRMAWSALDFSSLKFFFFIAGAVD